MKERKLVVEKKKYYKLVESGKSPDVYESFTKEAQYMGCQYRLGETTEAKVGGCLVFASIGDVAEFLSRNLDSQEVLLEVECEEPVELPIRRAVLECLPEEDVVWWVRNVWEKKLVPGLPWPRGTLAFKKVTPIDEIEFFME